MLFRSTVFLTELVGSDKMLLVKKTLAELYPNADEELVKAFEKLFAKTRAYRDAVWQQHALFWDYVNAEGEDQRMPIAEKCKEAWNVINNAGAELLSAGKVCTELKEKMERRYLISLELPKPDDANQEDVPSQASE